METLRWVLASQSPRRQSLLRLFGKPFEVHPAQVDEHLPEYSARPALLGKRLARAKAEAVAPCYDDALIIAADTLVVIDGRVLGKPADAQEAFEMLRLLSGRTHVVITALCLLARQGGRTVQIVQDAPRSRVTFRPLSDEWIRWYIATGEPFDKAGAYGIQEYGALLIDKVQGCYFNVVGLPLATLAKRLEELGVDALQVSDWHKNCCYSPQRDGCSRWGVMMKTAYRFLGSIIAIVGILSGGSAQTLTWLGTLGGGSSSANGVSDDGSVVVGNSDTSGSGVRAFRWTQSTGMVSLGTLGGPESFGRAVSGDGSVIVGAADSNSRREAFRWTQSTGMQPIEPRGLSSAAAGVSANGLVVAGGWRFSLSPLVDYGFVRTSVQTFDLEAFSGSRVFVQAISRNGGVVVGSATIYPAPNVTVRAFRWTTSGGMQNLGQLGTGVFNNSEAFCLSEDGAMVYGLSEQGTGGGWVMFRWTAQTGMQSTGAAMNPLATTADGAVVVGHVGFSNAVRWTQANGIENLNTTYASLLSNGSSLRVATAVSPDGRFIVGQGYNAATDRNEAFLLDTQPSCAAHNGDVDASGCVDDADLLAVLFAFGQTGQNLGRVDINCDGTVDDADLLIVLFNFGVGC